MPCYIIGRNIESHNIINIKIKSMQTTKTSQGTGRQKSTKSTSTPDRVKISTPEQTPKIIETILPAIPNFQAIKIIDTPSLTKATDYLSKANKFLTALEADRKAITAPIKASIKAIEAKYKPTEDMLNAIIVDIRKQMSQYQTALVEAQRKAEQAISDRVEKGTLTLPTAIKKIESLPEVTQKVATDAGSVSFKESKILKIKDESAIKDYITKTQDWSFTAINETELLAKLKAGVVVPGAEVEIIMVPINRR